MAEQFIDETYLREHPNEVFVFGDNHFRYGTGGAAALRHLPNTYGFVTKKSPTHNDEDYYRPEEYRPLFWEEMTKLIGKLLEYPDRTFLISKVGAGLANKYGIFEQVIEPNIRELAKYPNVRFLW